MAILPGHTALGLVIWAFSTVLAVAVIRGQHAGRFKAVTVAGWVGVTGAAFNGGSFLNYGHAISSFLMTVGLVLAAGCYVWGLAIGVRQVGETKRGDQVTSSGRATEVVVDALHLIAERDLEGFRLRALAERVGVNHATLLHYFPTKEAVIQGVVAFVMEQFRQDGMAHGDRSAEAALRHELEDFRRRLTTARDVFQVLNELQLRAYRDPEVHAPLRA